MSGGGGIIIIHGKNAGGVMGQDYQCPVASAEAALTVLQAHPASDSAFITALQNAIADAQS